jgi:transposase
MLGVVYAIYDDGRPLVEAYDGPQIVGMDLHRRRSVLVRMTADGRKLATVRVSNSPARLAAEIAKAGQSPQVVLEACYGWYWAADALAEAGAEVHLAHPLGVKGFAYRRVKNDERDAADLADLLRMGRLPEAWIAPPEIRELREVTRYRCKLVGIRTSCKDQVHGVLAKLGVEVSCSDIFGGWGSAWLDELALPQPYAGKVASLRQLIAWLDAEIGVLDQVAAELLSGHEGYQAIQALPGIGRVLGAVIVAEIGDITRFRHPARLCSWAGLTPRHREPIPRSSGAASLSRARGCCAGRSSRLCSTSRPEPVSARPRTLSSPAAAPRRATSPRWPRPASCSPACSMRCATGRPGAWPPARHSRQREQAWARAARDRRSAWPPPPGGVAVVLIDPAARADQPHAPRPDTAGLPEGMSAARRLPAPGLPMGPAASPQSHRPCFPGARLSARARLRQGRLRRRLRRPGLRPVLDPATR